MTNMDDKDEKKGREAAKAARAQSLLAKIMRGSEPRVVKWPGLDLDVKLRVLSCSEVQDCYAAAFARFADLKIPTDTVQTAGPFEEEIATQVLFHACLKPDDGARIAIDVDDLRDNTTPAERSAMFELYAGFAESVDPIPTALTAEQRRAIADAVKKKDAASLKRFGSSALATFMTTSDAQPWS
jgi:hypothetical protein